LGSRGERNGFNAAVAAYKKFIFRCGRRVFSLRSLREKLPLSHIIRIFFFIPLHRIFIRLQIDYKKDPNFTRNYMLQKIEFSFFRIFLFLIGMVEEFIAVQSRNLKEEQNEEKSF
jgi:hypothetical protein